MSDTLVFYAPVELGLELVAAIGSISMNTELELLNHIIDKVDSALLIMTPLDLQGPYAGGIINGGVLETPDLFAILGLE